MEDESAKLAELEKQMHEQRDKASALGKEVEHKTAELSESKVRYQAAVDACDKDQLKVCVARKLVLSG